MTTGYLFTATCPQCETVLEPVANGRPQIITTRAVARCHPCRKDYIITVQITGTMPAAPPPEPVICEEPVERNMDALHAWTIDLLMGAS